jgi:predicted transposase YbfD/YdcC
VPDSNLSSLITVPARDLSAALSAGGAERRGCCLSEWLLLVPDPRARAGRWHPLEFVLALAVCAFTAAGHDSPTAIAEWARDCSRETLLALGARPCLLTGLAWAPSARTFSRILQKVNADALNRSLYAFLDAMPAAPPGELPQAALREREQRRAAAEARKPAVPGMLAHVAADGKTARGAVRPDGSQVHLLSAFHVGEERTMAQREVDAKSNEIPEMIPMLEEIGIGGMVATMDAMHGQRATAEKIDAMGGFYLQFIKSNQPALMESIAVRLTGTDAELAGEAWTEEGKGHGRREKRGIRTAPASGIDWPAAQQVFRIRRDSGSTHGPWESREFALGITSLPAGLAGPRQLAAYARRHWAIENREHYVRDVTFREDAQKTRTGNQPNALAAIRNLVTGAFRRKGHANTAAARRYYARDDQRILALYGYA